MAKSTFVCPICATVELVDEIIRPRCKNCRVLLEKCGSRQHYRRICRLGIDERRKIANSDQGLF